MTKKKPEKRRPKPEFITYEKDLPSISTYYTKMDLKGDTNTVESLTVSATTEAKTLDLYKKARREMKRSN